MVFFGILYFSLQSNYFITVGYRFFKAWLEGLSHNCKMFFFCNNAWILEAWWCLKKIKHKKLLTHALHSSFTPPFGQLVRLYMMVKNQILSCHLIRLNLLFSYVWHVYLSILWCVTDIIFSLFFLSFSPSS
jgi:hypothetical protein